MFLTKFCMHFLLLLCTLQAPAQLILLDLTTLKYSVKNTNYKALHYPIFSILLFPPS